MVQKTTFIQKLYRILEDEAFHHLICWGDSGSTFLVLDSLEFSKNVLPKVFKHNNYTSFVRQLNLYGFHKLNRSYHRHNLNDDVEQVPEPREFFHPKFIRTRPDLLPEIRRRTGGNAPDNRNTNANTNASTESTDTVKEELKLNRPVLQAPMFKPPHPVHDEIDSIGTQSDHQYSPEKGTPEEEVEQRRAASQMESLMKSWDASKEGNMSLMRDVQQMMMKQISMLQSHMHEMSKEIKDLRRLVSSDARPSRYPRHSQRTETSPTYAVSPAHPSSASSQALPSVSSLTNNYLQPASGSRYPATSPRPVSSTSLQPPPSFQISPPSPQPERGRSHYSSSSHQPRHISHSPLPSHEVSKSRRESVSPAPGHFPPSPRGIDQLVAAAHSSNGYPEHDRDYGHASHRKMSISSSRVEGDAHPRHPGAPSASLSIRTDFGHHPADNSQRDRSGSSLSPYGYGHHASVPSLLRPRGSSPPTHPEPQRHSSSRYHPYSPPSHPSAHHHHSQIVAEPKKSHSLHVPSADYKYRPGHDQGHSPYDMKHGGAAPGGPNGGMYGHEMTKSLSAPGKSHVPIAPMRSPFHDASANMDTDSRAVYMDRTERSLGAI
ncbi:HSF-type DNA-binding-domain-containing protein [Polychytrium aggregatum]|uniref:HSF-type DNA-binding-domain-containing protein n=1 Tax=Polychytrium aggregatum TaxID=110093 RepID=UPI0022FEC5D2|nr:HSF-type DNA-binding-domain-containing protein [Polychytrium aggregatum]KAI9204331.1 HSF-type DNA-binding-domain-containing protein [Polychytrium aggregatum]